MPVIQLGIKNSVSKSLQSIIKGDDFIKCIVQKVTERVTKTLGIRIRKKYIDLNKRCANYSSVTNELKEDTDFLKSQNHLQMKYDGIDQKVRLNNLRLFKVNESPQGNLIEIITKFLKQI